MSRYFADIDGYENETLWHQMGDDNPTPVLAKRSFHEGHRDELWAVIVEAVTS